MPLVTKVPVRLGLHDFRVGAMREDAPDLLVIDRVAVAYFCAFTAWQSVRVERRPLRLENAFADFWVLCERSLVEATPTVTTLDETIRQQCPLV